MRILTRRQTRVAVEEPQGWRASLALPLFLACLAGQRVGALSALVTAGFSFDDEPTVNSKIELTVATSGSHNLRRCSNCNLCACSLAPCATGSPSVSRR
jgi:predicted benzoate:H+ symporter BenE